MHLPSEDAIKPLVDCDTTGAFYFPMSKHCEGFLHKVAVAHRSIRFMGAAVMGHLTSPGAGTVVLEIGPGLKNTF